jgi:hypothetical protein
MLNKHEKLTFEILEVLNFKSMLCNITSNCINTSNKM